jgi:hypothetical protein
VVFVDVDNDGDLDLFNGNTWEPNQLYINDGTGYFVEQSSTRGIEVINGETRGVVAFDANNDGYIDLYAANWGMQNELYINDGHGFLCVNIWVPKEQSRMWKWSALKGYRLRYRQ